MTTENQKNHTSPVTSRHNLILCCIILLLLALGTRLLVWQYNRAAITPVMSSLTAGYKNDARILARGDIGVFLRGTNPPSDASVLAHPPGYSILMAAVFSLFGESDFALRFFQILCDAVSIVVVFLIALELTSKRVAMIAGVLTALSPQIAYTSLLLLPDSLSVLPILLSIYLIVRTRSRSHRWFGFAVAGGLIGLSCWLRPNVLLLPLFVVGLIVLISRRGERLRAVVPLIGAAILVIAPLTIRNVIVFDRFVPISLGSGVTMIEGIADYDNDGRMGLPQTDMDTLHDDARLNNRPDYAGSLYNPDGIERERARVARGVNAIRSRPVWFMGVMIQRAGSMTRSERVPVISGSPLSFDANSGTAPQTTLIAVLLRVPGVILKSIQKLFITAVMLPLFLIGIVLLWRKRKWDALAILLLVPVYYFCVQSLLHTEYRYVIAIQYFLLIFIAVSIDRASAAIWYLARRKKA